MKKRPDKNLPRDWCLYVILHAEWRASRGKKPSMSYNGIRNPKKALEAAMNDQCYDWGDNEDEDWMMDVECDEPIDEKLSLPQWTDQDELRCSQSPMLNNFRIFASNLEQEDVDVEDFFWIVISESVENGDTALTVLALHRNKLAKKIARELLEMV